MNMKEKLKIIGVVFLLVTYITIVAPTSLEVDGLAYIEKFDQLKTQYPKLTFKTYELICWEGRMFRVGPETTCAFIDAESGWKTRAVSRVGAIGLLQVMPYMYVRLRSNAGYKHVNKWDLLRPGINICSGLTILSGCIRKARGNIILAAKYYNAGNTSYFNGPYIMSIIKSLAVSNPNRTMREVILAANGGSL